MRRAAGACETLSEDGNFRDVPVLPSQLDGVATVSFTLYCTEISIMLDIQLEHSFIWCRNLDVSGSRSETSRMF